MKQRIIVEFETREYELSHGRPPRGYGSWAFRVRGKIVWVQGTYLEAKRTLRTQIPEIVGTPAPTSVLVRVLP